MSGRACRVTWKRAGRKHAAHGVFPHVIDAVLWVMRTAPGSTAIVASPSQPAQRKPS